MVVTVNAFFKASKILKTVSPVDIYSSNWRVIPSPTREHIVPKKLLSKTAGADMNNIFICTSTMNSRRGVRRFDEIHLNHEKGVQVLDGTTGEEVEEGWLIDPEDMCFAIKNRFCPPFHARGPIARTCMYMRNMYPSFEEDIDKEVLHEKTMLLWDKNHPVTKWEIERAHNIRKLGFPLNKFVLLQHEYDHIYSRNNTNTSCIDFRDLRNQ